MLAGIFARLKACCLIFLFALLPCVFLSPGMAEAATSAVPAAAQKAANDAAAADDTRTVFIYRDQMKANAIANDAAGTTNTAGTTTASDPTTTNNTNNNNTNNNNNTASDNTNTAGDNNTTAGDNTTSSISKKPRSVDTATSVTTNIKGQRGTSTTINTTTSTTAVIGNTDVAAVAAAVAGSSSAIFESGTGSAATAAYNAAAAAAAAAVLLDQAEADLISIVAALEDPAKNNLDQQAVNRALQAVGDNILNNSNAVTATVAGNLHQVSASNIGSFAFQVNLDSGDCREQMI